MALKIYRSTPFNIATEVDELDVFTGDGVTSSFTLVNKDGLRVGSTVQSGGGTFYSRANGGFTVAGDVVTTLTPPTNGNAVIVPGMVQLQLSAFDQNTVPGVASPRVAETSFYLADIGSTILNFYYDAKPLESGIEISLSDKSSGGADESWFQFAPALADGSVGTYGAAGDPIYTPAIKNFSTVAVDISSGGTSLEVDDGTQFTAGEYIIINPGQVSQEVVHITAIVGDVLTISGVDFDHFEDEYVYTCGRKFFIKMTVPTNASGGVAVNFYDLAIRRSGVRVSRI